jgi:hypothetical protein
MMKHISATFLAGLSLACHAHAQSRTVNTLAVSGTVTTVSIPVVTNNGTLKKTTQSSTSYRIGNREILQLMVRNGVIPSITGYSLVQKFENNGTSLGYFAWSPSTHTEIAASVFAFTPAGAALSNNTTINSAGATPITTGTITGKTFGTLSLSGSNCALLDTVTKTFGKTAKVSNATVTFTSVTSKGTLIGMLDATGPSIDAVLDSKGTKPFTGP